MSGANFRIGSFKTDWTGFSTGYVMQLAYNGTDQYLPTDHLMYCRYSTGHLALYAMGLSMEDTDVGNYSSGNFTLTGYDVAGGTVPATATGYIKCYVAGNARYIPFFATI
jgi:hypothetical protein